ncbi:MAG: hypothetical protein DHS20C15_00120 [Planctomycetota bacterium]|nr:MAG: hypothetical protein DHS20C15_00120 [Planctomycetota bacterium]
MKPRTSSTLFALAETLALLLVVLPGAHLRSLLESFLAPGAELEAWAPDEPWFILARSLLVVIAIQAGFALRDLYRWSVLVRPQLVVVRLLEALSGVFVTLLLLNGVLGAATREFSSLAVLARLQTHPLLLAGCLGVSFLLAYGLRMRWPRWLRGAGLSERVVLAGRGPSIDLVEEELRRRHDPSIRFMGHIDKAEGAPRERTLLGAPTDAPRLALELQLARAVVSDRSTFDNDTLLRLRMADVRISDANSFYERLTGRLSPESLSDPDLFLSSSGPSIGGRVFGRLLDVLFAAVGLALASPLLLLVAVLVKLESPGPIFYTQERVGLNGRPFKIAKFRSMRNDAEAKSGPVWASSNDARVTRVGKWLRKLRIDEIPQLWCVLSNDMTLVGPRPERPHFVEELEDEIPHYGRRHLVKPGVTGWAQINYSYGNTIDDAFIKLQYDLYYIKHRTVALDMAILLRTVKVVVLQEGAV